MPAWFAVSAQAAARRVSGLGLVIGRAPTCDLVLEEPEVSRRHVLLQFALQGQLDIVPFPGARTTVNGNLIGSPTVAQDGDVLGFPGGASVRLELRASEVSTASHAWLLAVHGRRIGLRHIELVLGGGDDDVLIECWPPSAAKLIWRDDRPYLVPQLEGLHRGDTLLEPHVAIGLAPRDQLTLGGRTIEVLRETVDAAPTARGPAQVTAISLEALGTGGLVTISTTRGEYRALLAERRFALAQELLAPQPPYAPGQYIPDEVIFERVWPRSVSADRGDLNQLVFRLRADLRAAGLTDVELLERYPKGGAVRALVDASVVIRCGRE